MDITKLQQQIEVESIAYGSLPFWSWNDKLSPDELRRQIARMDELGMRGFFMHARGGLETEYLSDEWYECVHACIDEARKRGMEAWAYDENGWPSGFAGGILLEDPANHAHFLKLREDKTFPHDAMAVFVPDGDTYRRVTEPVPYDVIYQIIDLGTDSSYVDTFDAEITKKFIAQTHAQYMEKIAKEDWGAAMPGFFTDEPQYFRYATPWSHTFPQIWKDRYGTDILDGLIALFKTYPGNEVFRYDYHLMMHEQFIRNFGKVIYDWCEENGCQLTGHAVEEGALHAQMWSCGGILPFYLYEHIPGIDYLGRHLSDDVPSKQLGSVCAQTGRKKALSEMFACCGWDVTPTELKLIAELQYVNGVNVMCQHLYAYSIRGQRKRDYPANYSEHLPWQDDMKTFDEYFNHLGYTLSRGEEVVNTLVIHPIRSCYLTYKRDEDYASVADVEGPFHALSNLLSGHQIPYHWGDETILAEMGSAEGGKLKVGRCTYDYIIIPDCKTLDSTTVALLRDYVKQGGKLWLYAGIPARMDGRIADLSDLVSNITFDDICAASPAKVRENGAFCPDLRTMLRKTDEGRILYIVNRSANDHLDLEVTLDGATGLCALDMFDLSAKKVDFDGRTAKISLEKAESIVLIETEAEVKAKKPSRGEKIDLSSCIFRPMAKIENMILLDTAALSKDGGVTFGDEMPVMAIKDRLLRDRFAGRMALRFSFTLETLPTTLKAVIEPMRGMELALNGKTVTENGDWFLDRSFKTCDIADFVHLGQNEFTMTFDYFQRDYVYYVLYGGVSESLRNCLWFDTEIECMMLVGDFAVKLDESKLVSCDKSAEIYQDTAFALHAQKDTLDLSDLVKDGYPFYGGAIEAVTTLNWKKGDPTELVLSGRYSTAKIKVNGKDAGMLLFTDHISLDGLLAEGENTLSITLVNSNRNLLGPHHCPDPEPWGVGPGTFSCENTFDENGRSGAYVPDRYSFVRFGFDI